MMDHSQFLTTNAKFYTALNQCSIAALDLEHGSIANVLAIVNNVHQLAFA